jgi:peptidoglycan/LPS O-acetylase OafA/YrhL
VVSCKNNRLKHWKFSLSTRHFLIRFICHRQLKCYSIPMGKSLIELEKHQKNRQIQSLRGIAVLAVISYHLYGFPNSGFLGVTSFFVLSGYVVTSILLKQELSLGSLRIFYRKRFLKLYPAMVVCILISSLISVLLLTPVGDAQSALYVGLGGVGGVANLFLHFMQLDYFGPNIGFNPFSHLWSLSIEFQFYLLLAPIIWVAAVKKKLSSLLSITIPLLTVALAMVVFQGKIASELPFGNSLIGYYGLFSNAFPLLTGVLLAVLRFRGLNLVFNRFAQVLAFVLLLSSFFFPNEGYVYQILGSLFNVLGTFILLALSLTGRKLSGNPLELNILRQIGDFSYSLYLWHWPLICFAVIVFPQSLWPKTLAALLAFPIANYSHHVFEVRIKDELQSRVLRRKFVVTIVLVPILLIIALTHVTDGVIRDKYLSNPVYSESISNTEFQSVIQTTSLPCNEFLLQMTSGQIENECRIKNPTEIVDVFVLGDSHAQQLYPGLIGQFPQLNSGFFMKANGELDWNDKQDRRLWRYLIDDLSPNLIILNFRWDLRDIPKFRKFILNQGLSGRNTGTRILLLSGNPSFPFEATVCKYGMPLFSSSRCSFDSKLLRKSILTDTKALETIAIETRIEFLDTIPLYCRGNSCSMISRNKLLYRDNNHLNLFGARDFAASLSNQILQRDDV